MMTKLLIENMEEDIEKLKKQIEIHFSNIKACEGVITYLMQKKNELESTQTR